MVNCRYKSVCLSWPLFFLSLQKHITHLFFFLFQSLLLLPLSQQTCRMTGGCPCTLCPAHRPTSKLRIDELIRTRAVLMQLTSAAHRYCTSIRQRVMIVGYSLSERLRQDSCCASTVSVTAPGSHWPKRLGCMYTPPSEHRIVNQAAALWLLK